MALFSLQPPAQSFHSDVKQEAQLLWHTTFTLLDAGKNFYYPTYISMEVSLRGYQIQNFGPQF